MSATFASMRYVNYRYWFVASLIASTGAWLQRVAQDWYVLTVLTDHDASQVGVVTALPTPGTTLTQGSHVYTVAGNNTYLLHGATPRGGPSRKA